MEENGDLKSDIHSDILEYGSISNLKHDPETTIHLDTMDVNIKTKKNSFLLLFISVSLILSLTLLYTGLNYPSSSELSSLSLSEKHQSSSPYVRKEIRELTSQELSTFFDSIWEYKLNGRRDGQTYLKTYDELVAQHALATKNTTMDQNHLWASFVVWHSLYVVELEKALQSIDSSITMPYWNWTIDSTAGSPQESELFSSDYFGEVPTVEDDYIVTTGPLAYFPISSRTSELVWWDSPSGYLRSSTNFNPAAYLTRNIAGGSSRYPTMDEYNVCLDTSTYYSYATFWPCVWGTPGSSSDLADIHSLPHGLTGSTWESDEGLCTGDAYDSATSPNDILFFLHHSFLDKLYYQWKDKLGDDLWTEEDPCLGYYGDDTGTTYPQPAGHNLDDEMVPAFYDDDGNKMTIADGCTFLSSNLYTYS